MKRIITMLAFAGILFSCSSETKMKKAEVKESAAEIAETAPEEPSIQWKAIDSDEALIATALMAAPAESRAGCKVIGYTWLGNLSRSKRGKMNLSALQTTQKKKGLALHLITKALSRLWLEVEN
ncbi:hypothetical protein R9C00_12510 [Flammeovirgaceae bacterium SG7u.111]|nr:hypothetical protein [Flammeovirgaceae bacterium SG7u.132]WPO38275.1 hypothetical protein R9C00_12510 [Flammeovirgaceae bacterium SG7u.111]